MVNYCRNSTEKLNLENLGAWSVVRKDLGACATSELKVTFVNTISVKELYIRGKEC